MSFFLSLLSIIGGGMVGYNLSKAPTKNTIIGMLGFALTMGSILAALMNAGG